jgi:methionyl-tRNA formyltransferase
MKIAILTTKKNWFVKYAYILQKNLQKKYTTKIFFSHEKIDNTYSIVFILSYHRIIPKCYLQMHTYNLVVHASSLPKGKGWAPLIWQVIEGKSKIIFTLFEANESIDDGAIYLQHEIILSGSELYQDLRKIQANTTIDICLRFIKNMTNIKPKLQEGKESFYKKRTLKDSQLDIHKTIKEQFNLLRTVDNEEFPAYFEINGKRYILKIEYDCRGEL